MVKFRGNIDKVDLIRFYKSGKLDNSYWLGNEYDIRDVYAVYFNYCIVGYLDISISINSETNEKSANINMIEMFSTEKNNGVGEKVIEEIFKYFEVSLITGMSLGSAIPFWYKVGANFEIPAEDLQEYFDKSWTAKFKLRNTEFETLCNKRKHNFLESNINIID